MHIAAIGVNHRTAPVEVRERLALVPEDLPDALRALARVSPESAILSTCNRTEVYAIFERLPSGDPLSHYLSEHHRLASEELEPYLFRYNQDEAVQHLFAVASGIDSMILGETEILGQVRGALVQASEAGQVGKALSRLFHDALRTGRRARVETGISRHAISVSAAAVQLARQVFGGLERCKVLVISAGEAGKLTAKSLRDSGAGELGVANRTRERATALAEELGGRVVDYDSVPLALADFDIVISATASTRHVIEAGMVARAMERRSGRALCLIDIAVPRDVDPESKRIPNVYLYDIDDLEAVTLANRDQRLREVSKVESIIDNEAARFMEWFGSLEAVPVIKALRGKAEALRVQEMEKTMRRLQHLSPEDKERIDLLTASITQKLLHDPMLALKKRGKSKGAIDAARELFNLEPPSSP
ncbi:MAG: glutamyl-tRNA reductase [Chloroflexi bacterium]|nr:glutamyl-tRNA reductase [Chloroflexota bacterium]